VLLELRGSADAAHELRETSRALGRMSESSRAALARAGRRGRLVPDPAAPPEGYLKFRLRGPDGEDRYLKLSGRTALWIQRACQLGADALLKGDDVRVPNDLAALLDSDLVGPDEVLAIHRAFGAVTAADFWGALAARHDGPAGAIVRRVAPKLRQALRGLRDGRARIPLGRATTIVESLTEYLQDADPAVTIEPAGSLRRYDATVGDLLILAVTERPATIVDSLCENPEVDVRYRGVDAATVSVRKEEVHLRTVRPTDVPFALLHYTGSGPHVDRLRARAAQRGWHLSPGGLVRVETEERIPVESEYDIYRWLELPFVPPELRHGEHEIDEALAGAFDDLLRIDHIRGDLHTHSLWSDGRDTIESMVCAAEALGYEYVAITDHSPSARATRVLSLDRLERQMNEVRTLRRLHPSIAILQGAEVDILPDGSLDLPDNVLEQLDIVLASLHEAAGHDTDRLMARYAAAMRHPLVHVITHPTNRLVGRQDGYPLDWPALFRLALETGTILEVDGAPAHLDMDGRAARAAAAAGVRICVDSDCHNAQHLGRQMAFGVATARRGGVARRQVLNTLPLDELRAALARKRALAQGKVLP
jgi:DNA polymerase (family 10)